MRVAVSIVSFVVMDENECRNVTRLSRLLLASCHLLKTDCESACMRAYMVLTVSFPSLPFQSRWMLKEDVCWLLNVHVVSYSLSFTTVRAEQSRAEQSKVKQTS